MIKKVIVHILNFLLVLCVFLLLTIIIISNSIFNKQYLIGILEKNDYYEKTYNNIKEDFKNYIYQSGLDESILDNLYSKEKVNNDINIVIDSIYENKKVNIDTKVIRETLENRINNILKENNRIPDAEEKKSIKIFEDAIVDTYKDGIAYSEEIVRSNRKYFSKN